MGRRSAVAVVALASAAALIAGCGATPSAQALRPGGGGTNNSAQSPVAELSSAIAAIGNTTMLTTSVKLGTSATALGPILSSLGAHLSSTQLATLAGAQITVEVVAPKGKTLNDLNGNDSGSFNVAVSSNGTNYVSLRSLNKNLYVQVDLKDLFAAIGKPAAYTALQGKAAQLPGVVQALVDGKWISVPIATLSALQSLGAGGLGDAPSPSPSAARQPNLVGALKSLLTTDVTARRVSAGKVDKLALTANARNLAKDLLSTLTSELPVGAASGLGGADAPSESGVPSEKITMTADVMGGMLSELSVNLGQYDKSKNIDVPLEVTFARGGAAITTPSGAVPLDALALTELLGTFGGGGLGGFGGGGLGSNSSSGSSFGA